MMHRAFGTHTIVPAAGGKVIDEHLGRASGDTDAYSVAHMFAPAGWAEPAQVGQFDEVNLVVSGRLAVEVGGETTVVAAGESCQVRAGTRVRYRNASPDVPSEYWSICVPAWRPDRVRIESED
ncbi:MAG TPA: cupin domain-containing protein [Ktedonobacterales bacterium]|jgi:probable rRNA maturation factor